MNPTELRIGNIVKSKTTGNEFDIVQEIGFKNSKMGHYLILENVNHGVWFEFKNDYLIQGIRLTEEWLTNFGFKKFGGNSFEPWESSIYSLEYIRNHWHLLYKSNEVISTPFKYVHQLQNLFFALIHEELKLKPES